MSPKKEKIIIINGVKFKDVTDETASSITYTYKEAEALTNGEHIASSD